jgi:protein gp37
MSAALTPDTLRDQCAAAGVPFFFKQWGEWASAPWKLAREPGETDGAYMARSDAAGATHALMHGTGELHQMQHKPWSCERHPECPAHAIPLRRVGKKAAGATLDGREHREVPA